MCRYMYVHICVYIYMYAYDLEGRREGVHLHSGMKLYVFKHVLCMPVLSDSFGRKLSFVTFRVSKNLVTK